MSANKIVVVPYKKQWAENFNKLKSIIWPQVDEFALSIEHVGSTSVPGLCAKPIIDLDVVVRDQESLNKAIRALTDLGYTHRGDLGIKGREAFKSPDLNISHHLYACIEGNTALQNHLILRNHLLEHQEDKNTYGALKMKLAKIHSNDIDAYIEGKSKFILSILKQYEFAPDQLSSIAAQNKAK